MQHIQIKGLDKPVSKLVMGSDFFRLNNGTRLVKSFIIIWRLAGIRLILLIFIAGGKVSKP